MKKTTLAFLKGVLAGFLIAMGGVACLACQSLDNAAFGRVCGAAFFSFGLLGVCFLGANLYTGKIGFIFDERNKRYTIDTFIGLLGNIVGAMLVGVLIALLGSNNAIVAKDVANISTKIQNFDVLKTIISSAFCGILIYLAVYLFKKFDNIGLKVLFVFMGVFIFVIAGFDHCIANAFYFTVYAICANFDVYIIYMLLLNILGNSLGSLLIWGIIKLIAISSKSVEKEAENSK